MPGWNGKRIASLGLVCGLAMLGGALQVGCHKGSKADNSLQAPVLSYDSTVMLATQNQPYTSVTPVVLAHSVSNGIGNPTSVYTSNSFTVSPALPAGLTLSASTGIISGTPTAVSSLASYTVTAANAAGTSSFVVSLGVQASSPVSLLFSGPSAVSSVVGASLTLGPPSLYLGAVLDQSAATGYGVSPALPAGLSLGAETGVITGTPTAAVAQTDYTLTATTDTGSANATVTLLVAATTPLPPLTLAYAALASPVPVGTVLSAANASPTVTGGTTGLFYTSSPALPSGLSLDLTTGVITGTVPASAAGLSYIITASNGGGVAPVTLTVVGIG